MSQIISILSYPQTLLQQQPQPTLSNLMKQINDLFRRQGSEGIFNDCQFLCICGLTTEQSMMITGQPISQISMIVKIQVKLPIFRMNISLLDKSNMKIRANSLYHKYGLIKLIPSINKNLQVFQMKINPLSGDIYLQFSFILNSMDNNHHLSIKEHLKNIISNLLIKYYEQYKVWRYVLQFLEMVEIRQTQNQRKNISSFDKQTNNLLYYYYKKLIPVLFYLQNPASDKSYQYQIKNTINYTLHHRFFYNPSSSTSDLHSVSKYQYNKQIYSNLQTQKLQFIRNKINFLKYDSNRIKCSNYTYYNIDNTDVNYVKLAKIMKNIENHMPKRFSIPFKSKGKYINFNFEHISIEKIRSQYAIIEKISRRKNYYTFMKEYVVMCNQPTVNQYYMITKGGEDAEKYIGLDRFIQRNHVSFVFNMKIRIALQYLCICYLCQTDFEDFHINLKASNIQISNNYAMKIKNLEKTNEKLIFQILQTLLQILFNNQHFSIRQIRRKAYCYEIVDENCNIYGPSPIIKVILKIIMDLQQKNSQPTIYEQKSILDQQKKRLHLEQLSNLIFIFGKILQIIEHSHEVDAKIWLGMI